MDRGFNAMVPQEKEDTKKQNLYDYDINFSLFGKRFSFMIKVENTRREK